MPVPDDEKPPRCIMSGSMELYAQIHQGSKTQTRQMSESLETLSQFDPVDPATAKVPVIMPAPRTPNVRTLGTDRQGA